MAQPILNDYNFKIERKINKGKYSMRSMDTYHDYSNLMLECLFVEMMLVIIKDQTDLKAEENELSEKQKILLGAMNYLEANYQNDPSLDETAKAINMSASYLSKVFSTEMNSTYSNI